MKNKTIKITTVILACLLLIGSIVGISAFAEGEGESAKIEIVKKNIAYEGALKILYAVDTNYDADTQTAAIEFTVGGSTYVKPLSDDVINIDGEEYGIVYSKGIAPKNMRQTVVAKPVILDNESGEAVVEGEAVEYSVWQYAINRFSKNPTDEQKALYTNLLDYGASVQDILLGTEMYTEADLLAAGGYANEYYVFSIETMIDGASAGSKVVETFSKKDILPATVISDIVADKAIGDAIFCGFTDESGVAVTEYGEELTASSWNKLTTIYVKEFITDIGTNTLYANYKTNMLGLQDFSDGLGDVKKATAEYVIPDGEEHLYVPHTAGETEGSVSLVNPDTEKTGTFVFEFDVTWNGATTTPTKNDWWLKIVMESVESQKDKDTDISAYRTFFNVGTDGTLRFGDTSTSGSIYAMAIGETINFRIEYTPTGLDNEEKYAFDYNIFLNGKRIVSKTSTVNATTGKGTDAHYDNSQLYSFAVSMRQACTANCSIYLDNMFIDIIE